MEVQGKVVIVTGASSGIGEATAKLLAETGAKVALVARSEAKLEELHSKLPDSFIVVADMSKPEDIRSMITKVKEKYDRVDVLVNNAGRGYHVPIMEVEIEKYHELFDLNVVGPLVAMQSVVSVMKEQGGGVIVNISSGTSLMQIPGLAAYSSLKRALNALSLTAREEFDKYNIHVSLVYPYITKTNFHKNLLNQSSWELKESADRPPFDTPEYVAEKVLEAITTEKAEVFAHDWMKK